MISNIAGCETNFDELTSWQLATTKATKVDFWLFGDPGFPTYWRLGTDVSTATHTVCSVVLSFVPVSHWQYVHTSQALCPPFDPYLPLDVHPTWWHIFNDVPPKHAQSTSKNSQNLRAVLDRCDPRYPYLRPRGKERKLAGWVQSTGRRNKTWLLHVWSNHKASKVHVSDLHGGLKHKPLHVMHVCISRWKQCPMFMTMLSQNETVWNNATACDSNGMMWYRGELRPFSSSHHWATPPGREIQRPHHRHHQPPRQLRPQPRTQGRPHRWSRLGTRNASEAKYLVSYDMLKTW